jgi:heat shock protein HtpX
MYDQISANKRKTWLLMAVFGAIIIGIGVALQATGTYGYESVVFAVVLSSVMSIGSYFGGDKMALWSSGAKEVTKEAAPQLYRTVENLCMANGQPVPKVHIIQSPALNAFATGRDPEHASIAVTTGLIQALENEELEGVLAHELSHIKNYDIRVMTVVVVLVGAIALIGDWFLRMNLLGGRDREDKGGNVLAILGLAFLILSPLVAELIKLAISRRREYLADASGALLTRYPEGLARALEKINQNPTPLQTASSATAHLFISNPFKTKSFLSIFSTHPPAMERIKRLREMT